ncbi:MAG TPA: universal stress protein [Pirellulales bacterium]
MNRSSMSFQNILLATDFSDVAEVALQSAVKIARRCEAKLTIAHVVPDAVTALAVSAPEVVWAPTVEDVARLQKDLCEGAEERLCNLAAEVHRGLDLDTTVLIGAPYFSIIESVKQNGFDLVMVGTRGMSAVKRLFVGSTATRLARACPAPVWIARREWPEDRATILAAVDLSPVSERVVRVAASLAAALGARLHVLNVYDTAELYGAPTISDEVRAEFHWHRRRARREAFDRLEQLLAALSIDDGTATFHVSQGNAYQVIKSTARRLDAGLVVMGSIGRRGLSALLIGNTAEKVLHALDRSLLIVKPAELAVMPPTYSATSARERPLSATLAK